MRILPDPFKSENSGCKGCTILEKPKMCHSIMDHEEEGFNKDCHILFVSESFKVEFGEITPFVTKEQDLIESILMSLGHADLIPHVEYTAAVKCLSVKDKDMNKDDKDICRAHIAKTIKACKPKLIFVCGNLPLVMLTKKSGIMDKRGKTFEYEGIPVVPLYHPFQVIVEPQNEYLFKLDIQNGIDAHYKQKGSDSQFCWELLDTVEKLKKLDNFVKCDVAVDIETTGLDFLKDEIQTIALSFDCEGKHKTFTIPLYHKEFDHPEGWVSKVCAALDKIFSYEYSKKIFHKAQFDTKFLARQGLQNIRNIYDTKLMQHMVDENLPKSLKDLVSYYFPTEQSII